MTVGELSRRMTSAEFVEWFAYLDMVRRGSEEADDAPEQTPGDWGASLKGRMLDYQAARGGGA